MTTDLGILQQGEVKKVHQHTPKRIIHATGSCGCTEINLLPDGFMATINVPSRTGSKQISVACRYTDDTKDFFIYNMFIE